MEKRVVTFKGSPLTLKGNNLNVGDKALNFTVLDENLSEIKLSDFKNKIKVISVTPSLDTPVCDMQAKTFEEKALSFSEDIVFLNISVDLPFAISRFCRTNNIKRIKILSDYREHSFGLNYGLLIDELKLLARAVLLIDMEDVIRYFEIVPEITNHPDYESALKNLEILISKNK